MARLAYIQMIDHVMFVDVTRYSILLDVHYDNSFKHSLNKIAIKQTRCVVALNITPRKTSQMLNLWLPLPEGILAFLY